MELLYASLAILFSLVQGRRETALDEYVWRPDNTYRWEVMETYHKENVVTYILYLVSQTWYSEDIHSQPVWWHHLIVTVPHNVQHFEEALLFIDGGSNNNNNPPPEDDMYLVMSADMASSIKSVVALVRQIPNQPIRFWNDPTEKNRYEDAIIAWTWEEFRLNLTDGAFLLRAPMTKGAVRAMDAMAELTSSLDGRFSLSKFFVTGASKRGWTAWTTAGVDDKRVVAFSPLVLDCLNFVDNINHHYQAYGGYSWVMKDYWDLNLTAHLNDPDTQRIFDIVDPISYNDRYIMPKYVVSAAGDEFFLPDDTYYFWDELQEPKYLNLIPNAEHSLMTVLTHVYETMRSFWYSIMIGYTMPKMTWAKEWTETGGKITVYTDTIPNVVKAWRATTISKERRDFRLAKPFNGTGPVVPNPVLWFSSEATKIEDTVYTADISNPEDGWSGLIIQARFPGPHPGEEWELVFTSEVLITPNELPFPKCESKEECRGTLL